MRDVAGRHKQYVGVVSYSSEDGIVTPMQVVWEDGRRFGIAKVRDRRRAHSLKCGGCGERYTVLVDGAREWTYLFREDSDRWFVEAKEAALPE